MKKERKTNSQAVCGNCGNLYKNHYFEDRIYCYDDTNGDVWDDHPSDADIVCWLESNYPDIHQKIISEWQKESGH